VNEKGLLSFAGWKAGEEGWAEGAKLRKPVERGEGASAGCSSRPGSLIFCTRTSRAVEHFPGEPSDDRRWVGQVARKRTSRSFGPTSADRAPRRQGGLFPHTPRYSPAEQDPKTAAAPQPTHDEKAD